LKIDIINRALIKLGEQTISSTQQHPMGAILEMAYEDAKKSLLSMYVWRFAIKRQNLAIVDENTGTSLYKYKYQRPSDCLVIVSVNDYYRFPDVRDYRATSGERYILEGDKILSNEGNLNLVYVADIDEGFPQLFEMSMSSKLASLLCLKIHQNPNLYQVYEQETHSYLMQAIQMNEIMQDVQEMGDNSWIAIRRTWAND
jgi:hypothetical protein